jgi:hypothetical protein
MKTDSAMRIIVIDAQRLTARGKETPNLVLAASSAFSTTSISFSSILTNASIDPSFSQADSIQRRRRSTEVPPVVADGRLLGGGDIMRSRSVVPLHLIRWMMKLDLAVNIKAQTKFVDFGYGLVRFPSADVVPEYRSWRMRTKVVQREL